MYLQNEADPNPNYINQNFKSVQKMLSKKYVQFIQSQFGN